MFISSKWFKSLRLVFLLVLTMTFVAGCTDARPEDTEATYPDFGAMEEVSNETLPPVKIEMPDFELTYSGELENVIHVQQIESENVLVFTVRLSNADEEIFTMRYHSDEGDLVTVLDDTQGNRVPVAFLMASIPENLSQEDEQLFYTAQEAVNEIVDSLVLK